MWKWLKLVEFCSVIPKVWWNLLFPLRHQGTELPVWHSQHDQQGWLFAERGDGEVPGVHCDPDGTEDGLPHRPSAPSSGGERQRSGNRDLYASGFKDRFICSNTRCKTSSEIALCPQCVNPECLEVSEGAYEEFSYKTLQIFLRWVWGNIVLINYIGPTPVWS